MCKGVYYFAKNLLQSAFQPHPTEYQRVRACFEDEKESAIATKKTHSPKEKGKFLFGDTYVGVMFTLMLILY